jgi:hypothetical protein
MSLTRLMGMSILYLKCDGSRFEGVGARCLHHFQPIRISQQPLVLWLLYSCFCLLFALPSAGRELLHLLLLLLVILTIEQYN